MGCKRQRDQISLRLDSRIVAYFDGIARAQKEQWNESKHLGPPPTRSSLMEQTLGLRAGFEEAVEWKDDD